MEEGLLIGYVPTKRLKILLTGFPGSGKSYSALKLASLLGLKKILVENTEKRRGFLYKKEFNYDVYNIKPPYTPEKFVRATKEAIELGYDVVIPDSLSHEWTGKGGVTTIVKNMQGKDGMMNWHDVKSGRHSDLLEFLMDADCHVIATARSNFEYEEVEVNGKKRREKTGTGIVQEKHTEFEFDFVFQFNADHTFKVEKESTGGMKLFEPGYDYEVNQDLANKLLTWLNDQNTGATPNDQFIETNNISVPEVQEEASSNDGAGIPQEDAEPTEKQSDNVAKIAHEFMDMLDSLDAEEDKEAAQILLQRLDRDYKEVLPVETYDFLVNEITFKFEVPF